MTNQIKNKNFEKQSEATKILSNSKNLFSEEWNKIEKLKDKPTNYNKLVEIEYDEFLSKIIEQKPNFIKS